MPRNIVYDGREYILRDISGIDLCEFEAVSPYIPEPITEEMYNAIKLEYNSSYYKTVPISYGYKTPIIKDDAYYVRQNVNDLKIRLAQIGVQLKNENGTNRKFKDVVSEMQVKLNGRRDI